MFNKLCVAALSALLSIVALATPAHAQSDGSFGSTSTGSLTVTASVPSKVRISGLENVTFSDVDPTLNASDAQNVCVFSNTAAGGYEITASGSGAGNAFTLANGALTPISYTVEFADTVNQSSGTSLTTGSALTGLTSSANNQNCTSGETASLIVGITSSELQKMQAGLNYSGTLTLVVAPE